MDNIMMPEIPRRPEKINRLNDVLVKYIFARDERKDLVLSLINGIFAAKGVRLLKDFTFRSGEVNPDRAKGKGSRLDILGTCTDGTTVNVEIQVEPLEDMVDRSVFYWSRLFPQINKGEDYYELKRTVCINILAYSEFSAEIAPSHINCFLLANKDNPSHILTDKLQIFFVELDKFAKTLPDVGKMAIVDKWCAYLSPKTPQSTLDAIAESEPVIKKALEAEDMFMNSAALLTEYDVEEKARRDQVSRERYLRRARDREIVGNMLELGLSYEIIAKSTGLPVETIKGMATAQ